MIILQQGAFFEGSDGPTIRNQVCNVLADRAAALSALATPTVNGE